MIDELVRALDVLAEVDPFTLADSESVAEIHRQLSRIEAIAARATASWDARTEWAADGARSGPEWLAYRLHMPKEQGRRCLHLGRALRALPHAEAAWLAGDIGAAHVSALSASRTEALAEAMDRDEPVLVGEARALSYRAWQRRLHYWRQANDIDGEERLAARQIDDRHVHLSQTFRDVWALDGLLPPIGGTIVAETLGGIEHELFQADWSEARARLGRDPALVELHRTPAQRRADALVEMATRARSTPADARRPEPLFTVVIGLPRFEHLCELANRSVVTPGSLVPWLDQAWVERVVFDTPSRVIDVGVQRRLFSGATRRAIEVRDLECFHHTCEAPIEQIDHVQPASWGGPTRQDNGRGACAFHNRNRHRRDEDPP